MVHEFSKSGGAHGLSSQADPIRLRARCSAPPAPPPARRYFARARLSACWARQSARAVRKEFEAAWAKADVKLKLDEM